MAAAQTDSRKRTESKAWMIMNSSEKNYNKWRLRWTIGRKLAAIVATTVLVGLAVSVGLQITNYRDSLIRLASENNKTINKLLATQM